MNPNSPNSPAFGGMKGCQLAVLMKPIPATTNSSTTAILTNTIAVFTLADSRMPLTSTIVTSRTTIMAGTLMIAVVCGSAASTASV